MIAPHYCCEQDNHEFNFDTDSFVYIARRWHYRWVILSEQ